MFDNGTESFKGGGTCSVSTEDGTCEHTISGTGVSVSVLLVSEQSSI